MTHPLPVDTDIRFRDRRLEGVWDRFRQGERMTLADGVVMLETPDVVALGRMADAYRTALHGDKTYFVFNRQLNPTNNWHRIAREWIYGDEPVTELGRQEAEFYAGRAPARA